MTELAHGISLSFSSSFMAEIIDVNPPGADREAVNTSHQGTTNAHTFTPKDLVDWGSLECVIAFNPGEIPPVNDPAEEITLSFPDGEDWTFEGFLTNYQPEGKHSDKMTASVTVKVSGEVSITGADAGSSS